MGQEINRLTHRGVQGATAAGRYADGGGLYLQVANTGARSWLFVFRSPVHKKAAKGKLVGRTREMGLGPVDGPNAVSLSGAREKAAAYRLELTKGHDPLDQSRQRDTAKVSLTFKAVYEEVVQSLEAGWRNDKHKAQWRMTLDVYAKPLHARAVGSITTEDVLQILKPIWSTKAETASRLRGRIEKVLDAAKAKGYRSGENPARWRGHLDNLLPKRVKLQRGHHPAMPWNEVPQFVAKLRASPSISSLALEYVILTACRSGEVLRSVRDGEIMGARWEEIDLDANVWTVPAKRMKAGKEHRVPLSPRAVEILQELSRAKSGAFIFPGQRGTTPLSEMALELLMRRLQAKPYTVHGFRSAFRDWAGECTTYPSEICEAALAHTVGNAVERAYRRADALEKRRALMNDWEKFIEGGSTASIVNLQAVRRRV
jgi:integrase